MFGIAKTLVLTGAVLGGSLFAMAPEKAEAGGWGISFYGGGYPSYGYQSYYRGGYGGYGGWGGGYYPSYGSYYRGGYGGYGGYGHHHHHHHCW